MANAVSPVPALATASRATRAQDYAKLPLSFEANMGQADARVKFLSRGNGNSLYLTDSSAVLALDGGRSKRIGVIGMELVGARRQICAAGIDQLPGSANYFIGNDPTKWHTNVPTYSKVRYSGVYPGVDLVYYGNQRQLEYDFVVAPGASTQQIRLKFTGRTKIRLSADGDLTVSTDGGTISFRKPEFYQLAQGERQPVTGGFARLGRHKVGFSVGNYDRSRPLIIDPVLVYSTYLGGSPGSSGKDTYGNPATAIAVDTVGSVYVTGYTYSINFPVTEGAFQTKNNGAVNGIANTFVTKLNATGTALVYSTYLGGSDNGNGDGDDAYALAVDSSGDAYVAGVALSPDFPVTSGAFQTTNKSPMFGGNAFVSKLNPTGSGLIYSTFLGGSDADWAFGLALDASDNAYITGRTFSTDFPVTKGAFQTTNKAASNSTYTGFVSKLNPTGSALVYSTYLGGSANEGNGDNPKKLAVDGSGDAYIVGVTGSSDYPVTAGAFQATDKAAEKQTFTGFVTKLNATGTALAYSTYLGGSGATSIVDGVEQGDGADAVVVDGKGNAYIGGFAFSPDFPVTPGAFQAVNNGVANATLNGYVAKLNPTGTALLYSTFLGGSGAFLSRDGYYGGDTINALAIDGSGNAYIAGSAYSTDFPVTDGAFQTTNHGAANQVSNSFVTELNSTGSALIYSTYLGGSGIKNDNLSEYADGIALDSAGYVYVAGLTISTDFPVTSGAFQKTNNAPNVGDGNAFVAKLNLGNAVAPTPTTTTVSSSANPQISGQAVTFTATVAGTDTTTTPTGSVTFTVDGTSAGTVPLTDGTASFATTALSIGTHSIKATYGGSEEFGGSIGSLTETINEQQTAAPTFSPAAGTYAGPVTVTISDGTVGSSIYYTTNGSKPTTSSTKYVESIAVSNSETIEAISIAPGYTQSAISSAAYTVTPQVAKPVLSTKSLAFGSETQGIASGPQTATLSNTGNASLTISGISITGSNPGDFSQSNNCGSTLTPNSSCKISITFTPASVAALSATLSVSDNATGSPQTVSLSGTGVAPPVPQAVLTPDALSFGSQVSGSNSTAQTVTLSNPGGATLNITGVSVTGADANSFAQTNTCGSALAAAASCAIKVTFTPASSASLTASLSVSDNAANSPQTVSLSGTGTPAQGSFTVTSTPAQQTISQGGSAKYSISVAVSPSGDVFNNSVTLSASGLPSGATAMFSPASVDPGTGTATSTMTVQTASTASKATPPNPISDWPLAPC